MKTPIRTVLLSALLAVAVALPAAAIADDRRNSGSSNERGGGHDRGGGGDRRGGNDRGGGKGHSVPEFDITAVGAIAAVIADRRHRAGAPPEELGHSGDGSRRLAVGMARRHAGRRVPDPVVPRRLPARRARAPRGFGAAPLRAGRHRRGRRGLAPVPRLDSGLAPPACPRPPAHPLRRATHRVRRHGAARDQADGRGCAPADSHGRGALRRRWRRDGAPGRHHGRSTRVARADGIRALAHAAAGGRHRPRHLAGGCRRGGALERPLRRNAERLRDDPPPASRPTSIPTPPSTCSAWATSRCWWRPSARAWTESAW